jgi:hypothetical protein
MTRLHATLEITTPIADIERMVNAAACKELNLRFPSILNDIGNDIARSVKYTFTSTQEYQSLVGDGELAKAFGLPQNDAISKLDEIIDTLANSIQVKFVKFGNGATGITGGINVYAFAANFKDILSLSAATVTTNKGQVLPWLDWLLIQGDKIIIVDYDLVYGNYPSSRAGDAIMYKKKGGIWRVPSQFAGDINNNWITRAIDTSATFLENVCSGAIKFNVDKIT